MVTRWSQGCSIVTRLLQMLPLCTKYQGCHKSCHKVVTRLSNGYNIVTRLLHHAWFQSQLQHVGPRQCCMYCTPIRTTSKWSKWLSGLYLRGVGWVCGWGGGGGGGGGGFAFLASFSSSPYISEFYIILLSLIPQICPLARK